jgi:outer membrane lipoprotein-sorting protein
MTRLIVLPLVFMAMAYSINGQSQQQDSTPPPDAKAASPDPALAKTLAEIQAKLDAIQSYTCVIESYHASQARGKKLELAYREERSFKRPDRFAGKSEQLKHASPGMVGQMCENYFDGDVHWQYVRSAPGSGQKMVEAMAARSPLSEAEKAERIKSHETPRAYKDDLRRLRDAHISIDELWYQPGLLTNPFKDCDLSSLKLVEEDENQWRFHALPEGKAKKEYGVLVITIGKADGVLREIATQGNDNKSQGYTRVSDVKLNPDLPESTFHFSPPQGTEVKDSTDDEIRMLSSSSDTGTAPAPAAK